MFTDISIYRRPEEDLVFISIWDDEGERLSFWSENDQQAQARLIWVMKAISTPFIIDEDQE